MSIPTNGDFNAARVNAFKEAINSMHGYGLPANKLLVALCENGQLESFFAALEKGAKEAGLTPADAHASHASDATINHFRTALTSEQKQLLDKARLAYEMPLGSALDDPKKRLQTENSSFFANAIMKSGMLPSLAILGLYVHLGTTLAISPQVKTKQITQLQEKRRDMLSANATPEALKINEEQMKKLMDQIERDKVLLAAMVGIPAILGICDWLRMQGNKSDKQFRADLQSFSTRLDELMTMYQSTPGQDSHAR